MRQAARTHAHAPVWTAVYQLLKDAIRVVPAVEECELIEANVGVRPGTPDDLPIFGYRITATGRRQLISNGYFRHGILLAALAGKASAEVFLGEVFRRSSRPAHRRGLSADTRFASTYRQFVH